MHRTLMFGCAVAVAFGGGLHAQSDTLRISLQKAEEQFLKNNLQLLAAKLNIDAARAAVTQAGLWTNPTLSAEQNIYNQFTKKWFDLGANGNTGVQVQQLFLLAGKRGKQVRLAEINAGMTEQGSYDLMRALKRELRTDLYDLYFLRQSLAVYDESIGQLTATVSLMENVYARRAVLLSELLRVKSLLFSLQNERLGLLAKIASTESSLRILLRDTSATGRAYVAVLDLKGLEALRLDSLKLEDAVAAARGHRPDFKRVSASVELEEANLSYQRALAFPDLTVGGLWSRAGSYIPDYYALTLSIDLPLFNRNQGNIEVSERTAEANRMLRDNYNAIVEQDVATALQRVVEIDRLYRSYDRKFPAEYRSLLNGMISNYQMRNISVIEFTDFIESFRTSMLQMHQLENDRMHAIEALNYATGTDLLNP